MTHVWPEGVPRDYDKLVREYGEYIENQVKRYNKVDSNLDDLRQHIWQKLMESNLLDKFVERANTTLPPMMTAEDAVAYLGISMKQWGNIVWSRLRSDHATPKANGKGFQKRTRLDWLPRPINGTPYSKKAVYKGVDIQLLNESGFIRKRHFESVAPAVTGRGFKSYLQRAIRNHWANWCRKKFRRHKERPMSSETVLASNNDGTFRRAATIEGNSSWEASLVSASLMDNETTEIGKLMLREELAAANIDMTCLGDTRRSDGMPTKRALKSMEILDLLTQGYTVKEAVVQQSKLRVRARQQMTTG